LVRKRRDAIFRVLLIRGLVLLQLGVFWRESGRERKKSNQKAQATGQGRGWVWLSAPWLDFAAWRNDCVREIENLSNQIQFYQSVTAEGEKRKKRVQRPQHRMGIGLDIDGAWRKWTRTQRAF